MNLTNLILDNRYRVKKFLGQGGMAKVYLADDIEQGFEVAIKILPAENMSKDMFIKRFVREFEVCSKLDHPNIVKLYSCGMTPDKSSWYYSMEVLYSKDLKEILDEQKRLKSSTVVQLALQMARAFEHYHPKGVIHRDLKPANVMVDSDGRVVIMDFGLVHDSNMTQLTKTGTLLGTPKYMSPEMLLGKKVDGRSDIFQMGIILHECLTGKAAFHGKDIMELGTAIVTGKYDPVCKVYPAVSKDWERFILNCVANSPDGRYMNATEALKDIQNLMCGQKVELLLEKLVPPIAIERTHNTIDHSTGDTAGNLQENAQAEQAVSRANPLKRSGISRTNSLKRSGISSVSPLKKSGISSVSPLNKGGISAIDTLKKSGISAINALKRSGISPDASVSVNAIDDGESGSVSTSFRSKPKIFTWGRVTGLVCVFVVLFMIGRWSSVEYNPNIAGFSVFGGKERALVIFDARIQFTDPQFQIKLKSGQPTDSSELVPHTVKEPVITATKDSSGNPVYSHVITIDRLKPLIEYEIALETDYGTSLPRRFSTIGESPRETAFTDESGDFYLHYTSTTPFSITLKSDFLTIEGDALDPAERYYVSASIVIPFKQIESNSKIQFRIDSIDNEVFVSDLQAFDLLKKTFNELGNLFYDLRKVSLKGNEVKVPFFDMWSSEQDPNVLFKEFGNKYAGIDTDSERKRLARLFWKDVEATMSRDYPWYKKLRPLIPGLGTILSIKTLPWQVRQNMARALTGIELMQGTAMAYRLPDNPDWKGCATSQTRPFPCNDTSLLPSVDLEIVPQLSFVRLRDRSLPANLFRMKPLHLPTISSMVQILHSFSKNSCMIFPLMKTLLHFPALRLCSDSEPAEIRQISFY